MQLLMEINGRFVLVEPAGPQINRALPARARRSRAACMLRGLLEGHWASPCPTAASQNLGSWAELLGLGQLLLFHKQKALCRSHTRPLTRWAAEGSGCGPRPPAPRSWWSSSWGPCWWCPSTSSCTGAAAKSTQKGLRQLCCKLSTWKWSPSGRWCGPRRIIRQVWGEREGERVSIKNYINPPQNLQITAGQLQQN